MYTWSRWSILKTGFQLFSFSNPEETKNPPKEKMI